MSPEEADRFGIAALAVDLGNVKRTGRCWGIAGPFRLRNALSVLADQCVFERALELHRIPLDAGLIEHPRPSIPDSGRLVVEYDI